MTMDMLVLLGITGANLCAGIVLLIKGLRAQKTHEATWRRKGDFLVTGLRLQITGELAKNVGKFWAVLGMIMIAGGLASLFRPGLGLVSLLGSVGVVLVYDLIVRIQHNHDQDQGA